MRPTPKLIPTPTLTIRNHFGSFRVFFFFGFYNNIVLGFFFPHSNSFLSQMLGPHQDIKACPHTPHTPHWGCTRQCWGLQCELHCLPVCSLSSSRQEENINVWRWPSAPFMCHHTQQAKVWLLCTIDLHLSLLRITQTCVTTNVCMTEMSCLYCRSPYLDQTSTAEKQAYERIFSEIL